MGWLFRLLEWWKDYRLAVIKAKSDRENAQFIAMQAMVASQMDIVAKWFTGFTTDTIETGSSVTRSDDEYEMEQNRLHPSVRSALAQSIDNAHKAGAFPDLIDLLKD